jgi:hypothetical protein
MLTVDDNGGPDDTEFIFDDSEGDEELADHVSLSEESTPEADDNGTTQKITLKTKSA